LRPPAAARRRTLSTLALGATTGGVAGPIHTFLADDHAKLGALLDRSIAEHEAVHRPSYDAFRKGLLRHIAMEEKLLLPFARERLSGAPLPIAKQLRADHAALAGLLVPTPTRAIIASIRTILEAHNQIEEQVEGLYEACDQLAASDAADIVRRLRAVPEVPVAQHCDEQHVHEHIARVIQARGKL
jgi:hypothetical protein